MTMGTPLPEVSGPNGTYDFYQAERRASGWQTTRRLSPTGAEAVIPNAGGVSSDHRYAIVHVSPLASTSGGSLGDEGSADYLGNPDGSFELVGIGSLGTERLAQGRFISPGGEHVVFTTGSNWCLTGGCPKLQLEPNAPPTGTAAVYDRAADGPTHVVSLLPGDVPPAAGEEALYQGASADGSVIAFKISGTLYVRVDNAVTKAVTSEASTFAGLSSNGDHLFYVSAGDILRFDVSSGTTTPVTSSGDADVVDVSADGSHVYFISPSQLDGSQGFAGEPNMYGWSSGSTDYIASVLDSDLEQTSGNQIGYPGLTNWTDWAVTPDRTPSSGVGPGGNSSRSTPDGNVLVFESRGKLTDYDNQGHTQIYRYDALASSLQCVSCNPSGAPATADSRLQALEVVKPWVTIHNVSVDGSRVFFETAEQLTGGDINGINDVYQWRGATAGLGGTVQLISSGRSPEFPPLLKGPETVPQPNVLLGVNLAGSDVFFIALESLVPSAPGSGSPAIYDARIGGGFPEAASITPCSAIDACRGPVVTLSPPLVAAPPKNSTAGGNFRPRKHRCKRFHRKGMAKKHRACHRRNKKRAGK